jgi:phospholipase C
VKRIMETPEGRSHIRDASGFTAALRDGSLPSVAFVKPHAKDNAHPDSSTVGAGDRWIGDMVREIMASRYWPRVVVVVTYDEGGGWFDHVRPPTVDRFGLGSRVPTLIVSPYAKRGEIAHGQYEHASILKLIEWRFGLDPLTDRDRPFRSRRSRAGLAALGAIMTGVDSDSAGRNRCCAMRYSSIRPAC